MNAQASQLSEAGPRTRGVRRGLRRCILLALAFAIGLVPTNSTAFAAPKAAPPAAESDTVPYGTTLQGKPEPANCGTIYGLRRDLPHNVESIDPVTGDSRVLFKMGDGVTWLNGLGLDRNTQTFWAVQQDGPGTTDKAISPTVFSYDTRNNVESKYTGAVLKTPFPRATVAVAVAGAFNPNSNIYYYGQLTKGSFYVYGFDAAARKPIPGIIAIIAVGDARNGDFAFDSLGRLLIAADGALFITQDPLPTTASTNPPKIKAREIAKLSDTPFGSGAFGTDGQLYLATGDGTILTAEPSSGAATHTSQLQQSDNLLSDFASCTPPRTLTLMKDLPSGRATASDQFKLIINGGGLTEGNVGTTTGDKAGLQNSSFDSYAGPVAVKPGATYRISEVGTSGTDDAKYDSSWSCRLGNEIIGKGKGREGSITIPLSPDDGTDVACQFVNTPNGKLSLSRTASPVSKTPVQAGDVITYTLDFTNTSSQTKQVNTSDDLSKVLNNATMETTPKASSRALTATMNNGRISVTGSLPADSSATVSYSVRIKDKANRTSTSVKNAPAGCGNTKRCSTEHPIRELSLMKAATSQIGIVNYSVTVTNTGGVPYTAASPATMTDDLSDLKKLGALYYGDAVVTSGTAAIDGDTLKWSGALGVGESATIRYSFDTGKVDQSEQLTNQACVPIAGQSPECKKITSPVPPAPKTEQPCEGADCRHLSPEFIQVLEGANSEIASDAEADYVLNIHNPHSEPLEFDLVDYLSDVLDDATVIGDPLVSRDTVTVDRTNANAWSIHGILDSQETVELRYRIKVNNASQAGDRILNNYIAPPEQSSPSSCTLQEQDKQHCTTHTVPIPQATHPIGSLTARKSADPVTGSPIQTGDEVTYTLNFANTTEFDSAIDTFDDLSGVLNNSEFVDGPRVSNESLTATLDADRILIRGTLPAGSFTSISYSMRVKSASDRASNRIINTLADCAADQECIIQHPIRELNIAKETTSANGVVSYTVTVTNTGEAPFSKDTPTSLSTSVPATMTDNLAGLISLGAVYRDDVTATTGKAELIGDTLRWSGALQVGESAQISYSFDSSQVATGEDLSNTACVPAADEDILCEAVLTPVNPQPRPAHRERSRHLSS